jgi:hypothetical protein
MTTKKEKELAAFHARQAERNRQAVPVDSVFERKSFKPAMPEDNSSGYDVLSYSHNNDRHC